MTGQPATTLQNNQRQDILRIVHEHGGRVSLSILTTELASNQTSSLPEVIAAVHELHLPKLSEDELIEYEPESGVVLATDSERLETALSKR